MRPQTLLLIGCLSLSRAALADDTSKPAGGDAESASAVTLKYKSERGIFLKLNDSVSFRFDALVQIQGTNDPDVLSVQSSPVVPRRLKLSLQGKFTDYASIKFAVDLAPLLDISPFADAFDDDSGVLNDAWLEGDISDKLCIRAGYFKTPFGRQRTNSSSALLLPNRSAATGKFTVAAVPVAVARIVANPLGALKDDEGALKPVDELHVSLGVNVGVPFASNNDTGNLGVGLDAAFEVNRLSGTAEVFARARQLEDPTLDANGDVIAAAPNGDTQLQPGAHLQAGVLLVPKRLQLGARFGVIGADPDFSDGNNNGKFNQQGLKTESSFGLNGFILERRLMIQGMFSHFTEQGDIAENIVTLQLQGSL
jgi:hypothetical protein